nr:unnamed protein product [Digitaria exilis]
MDAPPAAPRPNWSFVTSESTRLDVVTWPPGGQTSELVLHVEVAESHRWLGIGGGRGSTRKLRPDRSIVKDASLVLSTSGPEGCLRRAGDCRCFIRDMLREKLVWEFGRFLLRDECWEDAVPQGVEAGIVERVLAMPPGCTCEVFVGIVLHVTFCYFESLALRRACAQAAVDQGMTATGARLDDAGPPLCSICLEDMMEEAETTCLPDCAHGFHSRCVQRWFQKASTCPVCRRNKFQYLPPSYRAVRDMMHSGREDSC